jgi:arylsulfatase A-like enzyme
MSKLSRRDFLKLAALTPAAMAFSGVAQNLQSLKIQGGNPLTSVIILVFDAMSARNMSLYDYPRKTTPNLERFAERATVYHAHHSAGNFTTPGVASLLTGMYPWSHRAINLKGLIARDLVERNLFHLAGEEYHRLAYSQNILANFLLNQVYDDIDTYLPPGLFSTIDGLVGAKYRNDLNAAYRTYDDFLFNAKATLTASMLFGLLDRLYLSYKVRRTPASEYPKGLPHIINYPIHFRITDIFDGLITLLTRLPSPSLAYIHIFPPHGPYRPTKDFNNIFQDAWHPVSKPPNPLGEEAPDNKLNGSRRIYDTYVANVDAEFGRLLDALDDSGVLDQSYVIVTSDHGEMFERGEIGHGTLMLYEPEIHIPLLVSTPGQKIRKDVYSHTSCVDVMPTLLNILGKEIPDWCEGALLPGLGGYENSKRVDFAVQAKMNPAFAPLYTATLAMFKGQYKFIQYIGYREPKYTDAYELYDLKNDPEELNDLYSSGQAIVQELQAEMEEKIYQVNEPFIR